jgi:hypothetical protein
MDYKFADCSSEHWAGEWLKELKQSDDAELKNAIRYLQMTGMGPSSMPIILCGARRSRQLQNILKELKERKDFQQLLEETPLGIEEPSKDLVIAHAFRILFPTIEGVPAWILSVQSTPTVLSKPS